MLPCHLSVFLTKLPEILGEGGGELEFKSLEDNRKRKLDTKLTFLFWHSIKFDSVWLELVNSFFCDAVDGICKGNRY